MDGETAYRSTVGDHEMRVVAVGGSLVGERCRVSIGGVDVSAPELLVTGHRMRGLLPDGRAFAVDVADTLATRRGDATLVVDGQIVPLRRIGVPEHGPGGPRLH